MRQLDLLGGWRPKIEGEHGEWRPAGSTVRMYGRPVLVTRGHYPHTPTKTVIGEGWERLDDGGIEHQSGWVARSVHPDFHWHAFLVTPDGLACIAHTGLAWTTIKGAQRAAESHFAGRYELREQSGECACGQPSVLSHLWPGECPWPAPTSCKRCAAGEIAG